MSTNETSERYDALVIGGGPAGLSAAIYLGRACRSVAVFDCGRPGRSDWAQVNHNYLGFPEGISIVDLCDRGRSQAERFGATFIEVEVGALAHADGGFVATAPCRSIHGRAVVLATGVQDRWPVFPGYEAFIGRSMHRCIVCDGHDMCNQRVVIAGHDEEAAELAVQMLGFAGEVMLVTNSDVHEVPDVLIEELSRCGIPFIRDRIVGARAKETGTFEALTLASGEAIKVDHLFSAQGAVPNSELAARLGVALTEDGYIKVDTEAKTSVPGVYAAGDVTRLFSHQVLTAAHEGATAASALDFYLYEQNHTAPRAGRDRARQQEIE